MLRSTRASVDTQEARRQSVPAPCAARKPERMQTGTERTAWTGNQSHLRLLPLQRKLAIGSVNDPLEAEADRVAEHVTRSATPARVDHPASPRLSRKCSAGCHCAHCKEEEQKIQAKFADSATPTTGEAPDSVHEVLRSPGQPLDAATRSFFEPRFGHDFSDVRIHTGASAAESARQVNALAYTVGSNVVFSSEQFAPNTAPGQRLLAHELTHVVQQRNTGPSAASSLRRAALPSTPQPAQNSQAAEPKPVRQPDPANGCYGPNVNGPGRVKSTGANRWVLWNFDIDQHYIKKDHFDFLKSTVVPTINGTPAGKYRVMVVGEASTTANFAYNLDLSKWRANCVSEELVAAGLDDAHRTSLVAQTGELRGDLEQIAHGIDPSIGIEDSTKRMVTIYLVPAGECTHEVKSRSSHNFFAKVACRSSSEVRINIGVNDPSQPIYREFAWFHDPWPSGCTFIPGDPPDFASHLEFVQTAIDLRLATGNPDEIYAPSDFTGPLGFFAYGANVFLARPGLFSLFKIGLGGMWNPDSCGDVSRFVDGSLVPLGPVRCEWAPDPPGHCDFTEKQDECSDTNKMAASKRFNGHLEGASFSLKDILDPLIDKLPSPIRRLLNPGGAAFRVKFGTADPAVSPGLTRSFIFVAAGNQGGGGSITEHFKAAKAPEQDATKPSRLATENPNSILAGSDLSTLLSKLVIYGASNKIELTTGAGTFKFFNLLCNHGGTRTYYGTLQPSWTVNCPDDIDFPGRGETDCKDEEECPESTRTAGHRHFTAKVGRATLANLPLVGRQLANQYGCKFAAAFLNIQSEDGPEKQIHRKFIALIRENDCQFNVAKAYSPISSIFNHQLAIDDPDNILAPSDFIPIAHLNKDGDLWLISDSNTPLKFKLPGTFDPACKVPGGGWGIAIPVSAVHCGAAPEPDHDSTPARDHTNECNHFRQQHATIVDAYIDSIGDQDYQRIFAKLLPGAAVIPPDEYNDYSAQVGQTISPAVFLGLAPNPHGGPPIQVVAFADLYIAHIFRNGWMQVQFLTDVCAFDRDGNVVLIRPGQCLEDFAHAGDNGFLNPLFDLNPTKKLPPPSRQSHRKTAPPGDVASNPQNADTESINVPTSSGATSQVASTTTSGSLQRCSCGGTCDTCRREDELNRKQSASRH